MKIRYKYTDKLDFNQFFYFSTFYYFFIWGLLDIPIDDASSNSNKDKVLSTRENLFSRSELLYQGLLTENRGSET